MAPTTFDRRALLELIATAGCAAAVPRFAAAADAPSPGFAAASAALTGFPPAGADDVARMRAAFATPARRSALARLERLVASTSSGELGAALDRAGLLADALVAAWYSGVVKDGATSRLVLYADAYVWSAMTFTKPMGVCGGVTGYWADPARLTVDADVIVVGAGIAGALVAERLASGGAKVLILEAGPRVERDPSVVRFFDALVKVPECAYPDTAYAPHPRSDNLDAYYVQTGPDKFSSTYLRQVGGTTWHWLGTCLRLVPDDFRLATRFNRGVDWPIDYAALEPWYGAAENAIGVAGDSAADLGSPRSAPYPMPPIAPTFLDKAMTQAFSGTPYDVRSTPQGRNSVVRDDRPPCCGNNSCIPICPIQAKYDATVHVARAEKAGARLVAQAVVFRLDVGRDGRVVAARYRRPDGGEKRVTARVFVLAAHAIEIPKLLLMSRGPQAARGVANSSDQVGRNLMDHPVQLSWALAGDPVYPYRGPLSTSGVENTRAGEWRATRPSFRIEIGNDGWSWPTGAPISDAQTLAARGLRGDALKASLKDRTARQIRFGTLTEQLPDPENRITPDPVLRDALGLPRPRIRYRIDDYTKAGLAEARRIHGEAFARLNATEISHKPDKDFQGAGHVMGTARMGRDAKSAVVDADLRAYDHPNLFIEGSAVFPTAGAANPTLTIAALALRSVAAIRAAIAG